LLDGYIDGELSMPESESVASHLAVCSSCSTEYAARLESVSVTRGALQRDVAPDMLRSRVRASLREAAAPRAAPVVVESSRRRSLVANRWFPISIAALFCLVVGGGWLAAHRQSSEGAIVEEALESHVRSLIGEHLVDVPSSDQHTVKPWFAGKIDFSPQVPKLDSLGFVLVGGRLDYLHGRPVAAIVYQRRRHVINLYSWPETDAGPATPEQIDRNGYHLLHWGRDNTEYWAVSDVAPADLRAFEVAFEQAR
jgi:anti-sigma factor RsiW